MSFFKAIPDEGKSGKKPIFTTRKIRKAGDQNLIATVCNLLNKFEDEGDELLVSEMGDLVDALHRCALLVQRTKQRVLLTRLHRNAKKKSPFWRN